MAARPLKTKPDGGPGPAASLTGQPAAGFDAAAAGAPAASWLEADRQFHNTVGAALRQPSGGIAVAVVDLPGLLEIAETYGEPARQSLLTKIEWRLRRSFGSAAVSRTAALRFSLMLQGVAEQDITGVVERIQGAVAGRRSGAGVVIVGMPPVGVALTGPWGGLPSIAQCQAPAATLVRHAELALQHAQAERSGTYRLYGPALEAGLRERTLLRQALLGAIDRFEFRLAYQPVVDLQSSRTTGLEALIRWPTPPAGISADPGTIIQTAEETGLIVPIGAQVLAAATAQMSRWQGQGCPAPRTAVNVAARQLQEPGFFAMVMGALEDAGLPPSALELELTERTLVDSAPNTIRMLERLRAEGVQMAVDDFGTGYSSLRYLQDLPVWKLKIDRSFTSAIDAGGRPAAMVGAMIRLGASLGLKVVAEGIETERQLAVLRSHGCESGQGYLFSRPMAASDAPVWFDQNWRVN